MPRDTAVQQRNFKIYQNRPLQTDKHMRTEPDDPKPNISTLQPPKPKPSTAKYEIEGVAGKGTFGVVYFGVNRETGEKIAVKKVLQDKKYKNREHQILKMLNHPNNLAMKESFLTSEGEEEYLNIVMDYFSDNLYQLIRKKEVTPVLTKLYAYQIFRGLSYLAMLSVAHRDMKPQNILVDRNTHRVVICDFGSAKKLVKSKRAFIQLRPI
jgi:glycogen synthase kinase 3 beta